MDQARIESEKKVKSDKTSRPTRTAMSRANANVEENPSSLENILSTERFSTIGKLLRVTGYVLRFIANLRKGVVETDQPNLGLLSLAEITEAKTLWYKHLIQRMIETSKGFKQVQVSLHLFKVKSGIWRCRGRLSNADIELSAKHFENFAHNIGLRKEGNYKVMSSDLLQTFAKGLWKLINQT